MNEFFLSFFLPFFLTSLWSVGKKKDEGKVVKLREKKC